VPTPSSPPFLLISTRFNGSCPWGSSRYVYAPTTVHVRTCHQRLRHLIFGTILFCLVLLRCFSIFFFLFIFYFAEEHFGPRTRVKLNRFIPRGTPFTRKDESVLLIATCPLLFVKTTWFPSPADGTRHTREAIKNLIITEFRRRGYAIVASDKPFLLCIGNAERSVAVVAAVLLATGCGAVLTGWYGRKADLRDKLAFERPYHQELVDAPDTTTYNAFAVGQHMAMRNHVLLHMPTKRKVGAGVSSTTYPLYCSLGSHGWIAAKFPPGQHNNPTTKEQVHHPSLTFQAYNHTVHCLKALHIGTTAHGVSKVNECQMLQKWLGELYAEAKADQVEATCGLRLECSAAIVTLHDRLGAMQTKRYNVDLGPIQRGFQTCAAWSTLRHGYSHSCNALGYPGREMSEMGKSLGALQFWNQDGEANNIVSAGFVAGQVLAVIEIKSRFHPDFNPLSMFAGCDFVEFYFSSFFHRRSAHCVSTMFTT
jgi:hypothetical protein